MLNLSNDKLKHITPFVFIDRANCGSVVTLCGLNFIYMNITQVRPTALTDHPEY